MVSEKADTLFYHSEYITYIYDILVYYIFSILPNLIDLNIKKFNKSVNKISGTTKYICPTFQLRVYT